ncbi:MAG: hypothetical protein Q9169_003455 [Polycauliona sp. 2 TL-2023]
MAPANPQHQISPRPTVFIPIEARGGNPWQREQHQAPPVANGRSYAQPNGDRPSRRPRRPRLPSVDEALQYSPFSSIVPFTTDIIPTPHNDISGSGPLFSTMADRRAAREPIELLDADIARTHGKSAMSQHALDTIKGYLEGSDLTDHNFKPPPYVAERRSSGRGSPNAERRSKHPSLGPFANMLLDSTQLDNRYPAPTRGESTSSKDRVPRKIPNHDRKLPTQGGRPPLTPVTPASTTANQKEYTSNTNMTATYSHGGQVKKTPMVLIPPLSAESLLSDYKTFREDEPDKEGKNRSVVLSSHDKTRDQRAVADQASNDLQTLLQALFDAEEQVEDTSAVPTTDVSSYFTWVLQEGAEVRALATDKLVKLDLSLQKVLATGRLGDISIDDLSRLQGLCMRDLTNIESSELSIDTTWSSDDVLPWLQRVSIAESALRSARVIVKIMIGLDGEKKVCSEEILQKVVGILNRTFNSCIIPIVEARPKDPGASYFELVAPHRKEIGQLLYQANKVMKILVDLLGKVDIAESIITALEFFAIRILFVENAQSEKESIFGIQKFEASRRIAMDIITGVFAKHPEQRSFIFDEILSSLQKLPIKGQHARQFKLSDGTSIQLVSALIVRLIQTSAAPAQNLMMRTQPQVATKRKRSHSSSSSSNSGAESPSEAEGYHEGSQAPTVDSDDDTYEGAKPRLSKEANELSSNAAKDAQYVVGYLVRRAMTASKTGDQPHRHLLDMFAEDLILVLSNPEWPAAELLLNVLMSIMMNITENKSTAPAKNMALELLGIMGSAISELVAETQILARNLENQGSERSSHLRQMFEDYVDNHLQSSELFVWDGPYRIVLDYLASIDGDAMPTRGAQMFYLTQWARSVGTTRSTGDSESTPVAHQLQKMLSSRAWNPSDSSMELLTKGQCRLAYALTVLQMNFCRRFDRTVNILLDSVTSEQITVRTRSLKSVTQMLEKDPSLLERARNVKTLLTRCATDASPMVRDSALMLIGKCIQQKPALEHDFLKPILALSSDPTVTVRKRSIKLLKEASIRNGSKEVKSIIVEYLLQRTVDDDKGVSELASQILEELWFSPFWKYSEDNTEMPVHDKLALKEQMELFIGTTRNGDVIYSALVSLLRTLLGSGTKAAPSNFQVCQKLISAAFESMIDPEARLEGLEQKHIVQSLTVFARADARLFNSDQLQYLQPYTLNLATAEDSNLLRSVVVIFRCVLPVIPSIQQNLLREIQSALFKNVQKLGKTELNEVAACLWTINTILNNPERLVKLIISVIKYLRIYQVKDMNQNEKDTKSAKRCVQIVGAFGKHCDLEGELRGFQEALAPWEWTSVSGMMINSIQPFASSTQPLSLRVDALNSIGLICQASPHHFNHADVSDVFQKALVQGQSDVQNVVLGNFRDFFAIQEVQASSKADLSPANNPSAASSKLGGSMKASEGDGASALIAQRFLPNVLSIALASQEATALTATEVIASINRQGLVHPKESGPALVALETSTNPAVASVACQAHADVHQQHESMFEREYMRAILEAYQYQTQVVQDPGGFRIAPPHKSKLHSTFEIIKSSKSKYQKKFISNFCAKIDFELDKLDLSGAVPASLQLSRFLIENLAFFDYGRVDELLHTLGCMERIVANTGPGVAHSINTEVFHVRVDAILGNMSDNGHGTEATTSHEVPAMAEEVTPDRLRRLTTASVILSCLWDTRTYLRRLYGLSSHSQAKEGKSNGKVKDVNKAPSKMAGISGERVVAGIAERVESLQSQDKMIQQCSAFVELLSVDHEVRVAAGGEEEGAERPKTPSGDEAGSPVPTSGGGSRGAGKRKRSISVAGTPLKKRGRPSLGRRKSSRKSVDEDEEWE